VKCGELGYVWCALEGAETMSTIASGSNGSSAPLFGGLARAATSGLYRPKRPPALWTTILTAACALTADEAERELLQRTRLLDIDGRRFVVAFAGDPLEPDERQRLRRLLDHALARVGLDCHRVHIVSDPRA